MWGLGKPWLFVFYLFSMAKNVQVELGEFPMQQRHVSPLS